MIRKVCFFGPNKIGLCKLNQFYKLKIGPNWQKNRISVALGLTHILNFRSMFVSH